MVGSVLLHVGMKLPDIRYGLQTKLAEGDVLTELPWNENPDSHSIAGDLPAPPTPGISRRGVLTVAGAGDRRRRGHLDRADADAAGTDRTAGAPVSPAGARTVCRSTGRPRRPRCRRPIAADWTLQIDGPRPYALTLAEIEQQAVHEAQIPVAAVEGWSVAARWRGLRLLDVVERAGGNADSHVRVTSLGAGGPPAIRIFGPQLSRRCSPPTSTASGSAWTTATRCG